MSYKTVLTHVEPGWGSERALHTAAQVARAFSAHLVGVGAEALPQVAYTVGDGGFIQAARDQIDVDLASAQALFRAQAGVASGSTWIAECVPPVDCVIRHARAADLVVARRSRGPSSPDCLCNAADLILGGATPVLIASDDPAPFNCKRVLIAWRDDREARRALWDAMPFLKQAEQVMLATVRPEAETPEAEAELREIAQRLKRHAIGAAIDVLAAGHGGPSSKLIDAAHQFKADLIVSGAYSHARLREWVLGGVTQDLLDRCSKTVLFSH